MNAPRQKRVRLFYCPPVKALGDTGLTALDHRILGVICLHDGMSRLKGNGAGCYASYKTLAAIIGTDITNFSKGVSKLLGAGYISREPQKTDKRRYTLRVEYPANIVGQSTNNVAEIVGDDDNNVPKVVGEVDFESRENPHVSDTYYISLKEELNLVKTSEKYSVETARLKRGLDFESPTLTAEVLRKLEADIKHGLNGYPDDLLAEYSDWLGETFEHYFENEKSISSWANRLQDEVNLIIDERDERKLFAQPF